MKKFLLVTLAIVVLISGVSLAYLWTLTQSQQPTVEEIAQQAPQTVRIGYDHNPRSTIVYRTFINHAFTNAGIEVKLITKARANDPFAPVPKNYEDIKHFSDYGQVPGEELTAGLMRGDWDAVTLDATSFIQAVAQELPLVAVAELAHDQKDKPSYGILFRKDVPVNSADDIRGKTISNQTEGLSTELFLKEFLSHHGLKASDVTIDNSALIGTTIPDGAFSHTVRFARIARALSGTSLSTTPEQSKTAPAAPPIFLYQSMDKWMNPELSHALLVFRKDFIEQNPEKVEKIVHAYMNEVAKENKLPEGVRLLDPGRGSLFGLQIEANFFGLGLPQSDMPPTVSQTLLDDVQKLLVKYGYLNEVGDLAPHINNQFVDSIYRKHFQSQ